MGKHNKMWRGTLVCAVVLLVSFGTTELVEELQDEAAVSLGVASVMKYHKIPGIVLRDGATRLKGKSSAECRAACTQELKCRSYSYSPLDKNCLWTPESMNFDPN